VAPPAPPSRRQSCCSTFSPATVWSRFTFRVFGRAPAGAAGGAGAGALPNRPYVCHLNEASSLYLVLADKFWHAHVLTCPSFFFAKGGAYIKTKEHSTTPNFYRKASSKIENDTRHYNYQRLLVLSNSGRRRLPEPRELHLPCRWEPPRIG